MPHVTFIHGIGNKVAPQALLRSWIDTLRDSGGPDLWSEGVTTTMCYWADVLYADPLPEPEPGVEATQGDAKTISSEDVGLNWYESLSMADQQQMRDLAAEVGAASCLSEEESVEDGGAPLVRPDLEAAMGAVLVRGTPGQGIDFERIPLPGPIKRRLMRVFLRDVHHYLWNAACSPRSGDRYHARTEIRRRALEAMAGAGSSRPHVMVGHSLGSVIAYDVLQNVDRAMQVDGLLTFGSPLGLDEVQDRLKPGWSRWDGFPYQRLTGRWANVYDRLDPVCGFDPVLANDFRHGGTSQVVDIWEPNEGAWRHSANKYLSRPQLRAALMAMLDLL